MKRYTTLPFSILNLIFDVAEGLLLLRLFFVFLGANTSTWFIRMLHGVSDPLIAPFRNIFQNSVVEGFTIEWSTIVAMIAYALLAVLVERILYSLAVTVDESMTDHEALEHHAHHHA